MIIPAGRPTFRDALRCGVEIFQTLKKMLNKEGLSTTVGDEGGFAPSLANNEAAIQWILRAIQHGEAKVWDTLTTLAHPDVFAQLIADQRKEQDGSRRLKNDDVTLMRLRMLASQPAYLLACR